MSFDLSTAKPVTTAQTPIAEAKGFDLSTAKPVNAPTQEPGFLAQAQEAITGSQRTAALPEDIQKLSELGSVTSPVTTGEFGSDIQIAAGLLTSFDPDARKDIIKNAVPGVTFEEVNDTTVVNLPNGQRAVLNAPGLSQSDLITGIGQALSFVPAGLISSIPRHLAQRIGLGAVTSGATEAGLQATSQALGSEQAIDKGQVATAAALGGAGEVVVPALKGLKDAASKSIKNLENTGRSALESSDLALQIQSKLGIRLLPAQKTLSPEKLVEQRALLTTEEGADLGIPQLKAQNQEVAQATENFLGDIANPEVIRTADETFRKTAEKVMIEGQKELNALFKEPFKRIQRKIDAQPEKLEAVIDSINRRLTNDLDKTSNKTAKNALTRFQDELNANKNSIEGIRDAKDEVDLVLDTLGVDSQSAAAVKKARRQISSAEKQLKAQLNRSFPEFKEVNKRFAEKRGEILGPLERSGFGKFANINDQQLKSLSSKVFDASETNPKVLEQTKRALKRSKVEGAEQSFDDLLRVELDRRILKSKADIDKVIKGDDDFVTDMPGILNRAIFGANQSQRDVLMRALKPRQRKRAELLEEALKRASAGRIGGSTTQPNQEAINRIEKDPLLRGMLKFLKSPIKNTLGFGDETSRASRRQASAEIAFDPAWGGQFDKISKMQNNAKKSEAFFKLLERVQAGVIARAGLKFAAPVVSRQEEGQR